MPKKSRKPRGREKKNKKSSGEDSAQKGERYRKRVADLERIGVSISGSEAMGALAKEVLEFRQPLSETLERLVQVERAFNEANNTFLRLSRRRNQLTSEERKILMTKATEVNRLRPQLDLLKLLQHRARILDSIPLRRSGKTATKKWRERRTDLIEELRVVEGELKAIPASVWNFLGLRKPKRH